MSTNVKEKKTVEVKFKVENSISLDPVTPIPFEESNRRSFRYVGGKKYIPFIGGKDDLPNVFLHARLTSTTHNACISSIAQSVVGKGIAIIDEQNPDEDMMNWFKCVNNKGHSLNEIFRNTIDGERTHGNQFIEVVRGKVGKVRYVKIYLRPMINCRLAEPEEDAAPDAVLIDPSFAKTGYTRVVDSTLRIPLWSPNKLDQKKVWLKRPNGDESTMLHFKNEVSGIEHYGLPASVAGLRYQILEAKSAQFNIDNFENNMILGGMLILKSAMTKEEAQEQAKDILLTHVGEGKTGRIAVISSESGLQDVDFKEFKTQREGSFIELEKSVRDKIIAANNWASELIGYDMQGALGKGGGFIRSIYDVKDATLLDPLEKKIMEKVMNPIMQIYADWMSKPDVLKYQFHFQTTMPFSFMGDVNPENFMKVNEARKLAGMEADDKNGEKYLSEMKSKVNVQTEPTTT